MYKSVVFGLVTLALSTSALAVDIPDSCLACRTEMSDVSFLACLQSCVNGVAVAVPEKAVNAESAGWNLGTDTDPMTDEKSFFAGKLSENIVPYFGKNIRPSLFILSRGNHVNLAIVFSNAFVMPSFDENNIAIRIDKNRAFGLEAATSSDNSTVIIDNKAIIKQMRAGRRALVQVQLISLNTHTFEFDLIGFDAAYKWCVTGGKDTKK